VAIFKHSASARRQDLTSPSVLNLRKALGGYAAAALVVLVGLLVLFRVLLYRGPLRRMPGAGAAEGWT
jgi:hypothetical protein